MSESFKSRIRTIPNHPKPGVMFRDITLRCCSIRRGCAAPWTACSHPYWPHRQGRRCRARGFILGGTVAYQLKAGFVPVQRGKLPWNTFGQDYALEYGTDRVEIHTDAIAPGEQILLVDDLIATGGTAIAALDLIEQTSGKVVGCAFIVGLPDLGGSRRLRERGARVSTLCEFEGD